MKPFLKWAGNKYRIIEYIKAALPPKKRLIEPFVGSGAVFLNTDFPNYVLADSNMDLIQTYQYLQAEGQKFITFCQDFFTPAYNNEKEFYKLRALFNTTSDKRLKSALFIYLNKHCFNGLCRYNTKGEFNTPYSKYKKPYFPAKEMLFFYEKSQHAIIKNTDFMTTLQSAKPGDVIYCDPPYVPLSQTANFTSYSAGGFNLIQQKKLAEIAASLANQGIPVIISNHNTEFTQQAYEKAERQTFAVQRNISCKGDNRQKANEILAVFSPSSVMRT